MTTDIKKWYIDHKTNNLNTCCGVRVMHEFGVSIPPRYGKSSFDDFTYNLKDLEYPTLFTVSCEQDMVIKFIFEALKTSKQINNTELVKKFINPNSGNMVWMFLITPNTIASEYGENNGCDSISGTEYVENILSKYGF